MSEFSSPIAQWFADMQGKPVRIRIRASDVTEVGTIDGCSSEYVVLKASGGTTTWVPHHAIGSWTMGS